MSSIPTPNARLRAALETEAGQRALAQIPRYFHATLEGAQHIPKRGAALIVSNHALFALDSAVFGALVVRELGRFPRFLADRVLWKVPGLHSLLEAIGALPGDPSAAVQLLREGELVIVYPGGVDDSLKLSRERYRLQWKNRAGFARVAMTAGAPIVPVAGLGIDEMYRVVGREHVLGRRILGSPRYDLPFAFGALGSWVPKRATQRYIVLPPIDTRGDPEQPEAVERVRRATYDALEAQLRVAREQTSAA